MQDGQPSRHHSRLSLLALYEFTHLDSYRSGALKCCTVFPTTLDELNQPCSTVIGAFSPSASSKHGYRQVSLTHLPLIFALHSVRGVCASGPGCR